MHTKREKKIKRGKQERVGGKREGGKGRNKGAYKERGEMKKIAMFVARDNEDHVHP